MKVYMVEVRKGEDGFRWTVTSRNGKIIAAGEQGFSRYRTVLSSVSVAAPEAVHMLPPRWKRGKVQLLASATKFAFL